MSDEENKLNLTNQALIAKNQNLQEQIVRLQAKYELLKDLYNELIDRRF
jgi:hypothetical protein